MIPENVSEFVGMPKIARLSRECVITEKIDGTNAQICISDAGEFRVASKNRWITLREDNYGFARWAFEHEAELRTLGPGRHFGEWWGCGIQRGYGLQEKRFSLFNVHRWGDVRPACCGVVPVLFRGIFDTVRIEIVRDVLKHEGSVAAPGFSNPEGIVVYHAASKTLFKKTILNDERPKGEASGSES